MKKDEFDNSWKGNPPDKKPLSMLVVKVEMECSCNKLFFTRLATTELIGDFIKKCPLCKRTHRFCWSIQTKTEEEEGEGWKEGGL